jgi:hypothetical protein
MQLEYNMYGESLRKVCLLYFFSINTLEIPILSGKIVCALID